LSRRWEFYADDLDRFQSKAIEVDDRCKGTGIGTQFVVAVRSVMPIGWSGTYTAEGARLKDRVAAIERASADASPP
jgi:hypothetical protein